MKKIIVLVVLVVFVNNLNAQDVIDKMSRQICKCVEKNENKMTFDEAMKFCFEEEMLDNFKELREYYKVKSIADINSEDLGNRIAVKLMKNCEAFYKHFREESQKEEQTAKKYSTDAALKCDKIRTGKYYYLTPNKKESFDTTHVIMDKENYLEIIGEDKTYSKLSIKWSDNCKFQLTFIESNDPFKSALSKKGDKYEYEVVQEQVDFIVLKLMFRGDEYFIEYFKE